MNRVALNSAADYIKREIEAGRLTHDQIAVLVLSFQEMMNGRGAHLEMDGKPGPNTRNDIDEYLKAWSRMVKCYPLRALPDGRAPVITSGFHTKNPSRPTHMGVDFFFRYDASKDPPVPVGDGGATRGSDGKPRWFVPSHAAAIAAATGRVRRAGFIGTGGRVAIDHDDGMQTIYCHLRSVLVKEGQNVMLGQELGQVGDNPQDIDAKHLHFEVSPSDSYKPIDPEKWLEDAEVLPPILK